MTRPWHLADGILAALALGLGAVIIWDLIGVRPLPPPPRPRPTQAAAPALPIADRRPAAVPAAIAARNLFSASRSELTAVAAAPTGPKPVLHGVLVRGEKSRAYLEDPVAKRVFGYAVGDTVSGGRLEEIAEDHVTVRRPDGVIDVLLKDPGKPKPAAPPTGAPGSPQPAATTATSTPIAPAVHGTAANQRGPVPPAQPSAARPAAGAAGPAPSQ